jgi:hypothetical protein
MAEPTTASIATYFSITKLWSITSGVCGSIIPILALADRSKITLTTGFFMALTGSSFSIFVGPYLAQRLDITSIEGIVALSWAMGATGVYIIRAIFKWLDKRALNAIDLAVSKALGVYNPPSQDDTPPETKDGTNN